jgi:hypothetical protein
MQKLIMLFLVLILLSSCKSSISSVESDNEIGQVDWQEINPPPGENGPCYAFFISRFSGYIGYGHAGVWCK